MDNTRLKRLSRQVFSGETQLIELDLANSEADISALCHLLESMGKKISISKDS